MTYTLTVTGAATQGLKSYLNQSIFAASFGLVCQPGYAAQNTSALNAAMAAAAGRPLVLPPGTCPINPISVPDYVVLQGQGQAATTLKLAPASNTGTSIIQMGNFRVLRQLTVDGNKSAHIVGNYGIAGYRVQGYASRTSRSPTSSASGMEPRTWRATSISANRNQHAAAQQPDRHDQRRQRVGLLIWLLRAIELLR